MWQFKLPHLEGGKLIGDCTMIFTYENNGTLLQCDLLTVCKIPLENGQLQKDEN